MKNGLRILMLEDNPNDAELIIRELNRNGLGKVVAKVVREKAEFTRDLDEFKPDIVLADYNLPGFDGVAAIKIVADKIPTTPVIIISGTIGEDFAIETLKKGAADYILKDRMSRLGTAVHRALRDAEQQREQMRSKELIRRHELRFLTMIENSSDGILLIDKTAEIMYAAPSTLRILGFTIEESIGESLTKFLHPEDVAAARALVADALKRPNEKLRSEFRFRHADGSYRWIETIATNLLGDANIEAIILNYRDVTDRRKADAVVRETERKYRSLFE
ncbi:MAG TPA: PAS domain S-box protein, partial [Bacteroidota bacterium]|nr:PAS domain S-box protein [Bacteroidota bacterium]